MTKTRSIHRPGRTTAATQDIAHRVRQAVAGALLRVGLAGDAGQPLHVARAAKPTAPAGMALSQATDAAERDALTTSYEQCLDSYRRLVQTPDAQTDDAGRAMAFFVAANLHALHGVDAAAEQLVPLESQLRGVARTRSNWDAASTTERQDFFERVAILAMVITGARAKAASQGAAALGEVRRIARQHLEQVLGLNPDLLTLGPSGLAAR